MTEVKENTNIFFYFSGHGCTKNDHFYFVLSDSDESIGSMLSLEEVKAILESANEKRHGNISIIVDACRDIKDVKGVGAQGKKYAQDYVKRVNGVGVIYSCSKGECSINELGSIHMSAFTSFLVKALRGEKKALDGSYLTFTSMYNYLEQQSYIVSRSFADIDQHPEKSFQGNEIVYGYYAEEGENAEMVIPSNNISISDLYFGTIDADSEMKEDIGKFVENYYDLSNVSEQLWNKDNIQFVIGRKGTGKTYIGKYMEQTREDNTKYLAMDAFDYKSFNFLATKDGGYEKYVLPWKYFVYAELLITINARINNPMISTFLKDLYGRSTSIEQILHRKFKRSVILKNKELEAKFMEWLSKDSNAFELKEITEIMRFLLEDHAKIKYLFILDGLDEKINEKKEYSEMMNALIWAIKNINDQMFSVGIHIKIAAFFRKDVFEFVAGANTAKIVNGNTVSLEWVTDSVDKKKYPLYQFMNRRYLNCLEANGINKVNHDIMEIFPLSMKTGKEDIDTWSWILNLTTYKPRDIVQMLREFKDKCTNGESTISETVIWEAQTNYSKYLLKEFKNELYGFQDEKLVNELFMNISEMDRKWVTYSDLKTIVNKCALKVGMVLEEKDMESLINSFYEVGALGIKIANGYEYWYYRRNVKVIDKIRNSKFKLHIGLWKALSIW